MPTIRIRLDRDLIDELRGLVGDDANVSAAIDLEVRALVERLYLERAAAPTVVAASDAEASEPTP